MKLPVGGGWHAIKYTFQKASESGGYLKMWHAMKTRNACKTCALGMGGQLGGMVNEKGHFPEFCKKSIQAMASDMQPAIPADFFAADFSFLEGMTPLQLETAGRITEPLYAGPDDKKYRRISWDEAIAKIVGKLKTTTPNESFFYFSGRSSNEAGFLLQLFARVFGTNNVNNCSFYCHQASGVGLASVFGGGTGTITLDDLDQCDLIMLIGGNPGSNHPRFMRTLMELKRRKGKVIIVNPVREAPLVKFSVPSDVRSLLFGGTSIPDLYVQPHLGGDIAFLMGIAKALLERNAVDRAFLAAHANGWDAAEAVIKQRSWDDLVAASGVDRATIETAATMYQESKAAVFSWAMGITHHLHGVDNVRMIANLAMMRGMVGRPGAGLMPLRGHSNIQGLGTVGVTPKLKDEIFSRLETKYGISAPKTKGMDTMTCMEAADAGRMRVAFCLGGNLFGANPDATFARESMAKIDQIVYLNTTLNTGHVLGRGKETIVLPVLARDEEPQPTTQESMFSYVRLSDGGPARHQGPRGEVQVIASVAHGVLGAGGPIAWDKMSEHGNVRTAMAAVVPDMEQVSDIDRTKREFHIPGRQIDRPEFKTPDGKAKLHAVDLPPQVPLAARQLRLQTLRSEGQFNTVVYEDHDRYRQQDRRNIIMISRSDRERMGLKLNQAVTVSSEAGSMKGILVRELDVRSGNAVMYYPEANVLVPRKVDALSGTPSFKLVVVTIEPD